MNINSLLSLGNEKESLKKLVSFVKNPPKFFEKNKENEESLLDFMTFITRLSAIINILIGLALKKESSLVLVITFVIVVLLARIIADIFLSIFGKILNFFAKLIAKKDNLLAAKRVLAYRSSVSLIYLIPIIGSLLIFLIIILDTIGISKQYKISLFKSFIITILPLIIIVAFAYLLLGVEGLQLMLDLVLGKA